MRKLALPFASAVRSALTASAAMCLAATALAQSEGVQADVFPMSDPDNQGGWVLNPAVSDEFDGTEIDHGKWFVQGVDEQYYIWAGRAPAQFVDHNVIVSDGMARLRTQWEPEFDFIEGGYAGGTYGDPVPVTSAAIISRERFLYGYMETRSRSAPASITSSFWMIGYESELDVLESIGRPKVDHSRRAANAFNGASHDWRPGHFVPEFGQNRVIEADHRMPFTLADEFHVYAAEWDPQFVRFFVDGEMVDEVRKTDIDGWVLTNPLEIWFDSEAFSWMGLPHEEELPADFEIDYVRVWQRPDPNILQPAFYSFEGPFNPAGAVRPLDLVPESSEENGYQQFWRINFRAAEHWAIVEDDEFHTGIKALEFRHDGQLPTARAFISGPEGSVDLPPGQFTLTLMVKPEVGASVELLNVWLDQPHLELPPIDMTTLEPGVWNRVSVDFERSNASGNADLMKLSVHRDHVAIGGAGSIFVDDISITPRM